MPLTPEAVKAQCIASQAKGESLSAVMAWAFGLDRAWGSVEVKRVWLACKPKPKPETFVEYLRRVGSDVQASYEPKEETSPTAEDYQRSADAIEDLAKAIHGMIDAFGLDDRSMFTVEQRRALKASERLVTGYKVMGKRLA